jgi:hypothetical protein
LGERLNRTQEVGGSNPLVSTRFIKDLHKRPWTGIDRKTIPAQYLASLRDNLEASLAHLRLPVAHRKYVRATNLGRAELFGRATAHQYHPALFR